MFGTNFYSLMPVLALAVLPSLIWLFFYLAEDPHPEPRYWLFIIFIIGIALAPIVIFFEMALTGLFFKFAGVGGPGSGLLIFLIAPFVEEISKYGVVHLALNKNPVLDEPVDGMIYVIASALGFAAIENVFAVFSFIAVGSPGYLGATFNFISMRLISAVALHGLSSGIAGYYFSKFYFMEKNPVLILKGLIFASVFHGIYNFLIVRNEGNFPLFLAGITLGAGAVLVLYLFNRLKHHAIYQQAAVDEAAKQNV